MKTEAKENGSKAAQLTDAQANNDKLSGKDYDMIEREESQMYLQRYLPRLSGSL